MDIEPNLRYPGKICLYDNLACIKKSIKDIADIDGISINELNRERILESNRNQTAILDIQKSK